MINCRVSIPSDAVWKRGLTCWRQLRFQPPAKLLNTGRLIVTDRSPRLSARAGEVHLTGSQAAITPLSKGASTLTAIQSIGTITSCSVHSCCLTRRNLRSLPATRRGREFLFYSSAVRSLSTGSQEYDREFQLAHTESAVSCAAYLQAFSRRLTPGAGAVALRDGSGSIRGLPQGCGAILRLHSVSCHTDRSEWWEGSSTRGVSFTTFQKTMAGSPSGPAVVPGHSEAGLLYKVISTSNEDIRMPFAGQPLSQ
jgi:Planctomycete cytochrome C